MKAPRPALEISDPETPNRIPPIARCPAKSQIGLPARLDVEIPGNGTVAAPLTCEDFTTVNRDRGFPYPYKYLVFNVPRPESL
jgi:hypothetical protein